MKRHVMIMLRISKRTVLPIPAASFLLFTLRLKLSDHFLKNFLSQWEAKATFKQNIDGKKIFLPSLYPLSCISDYLDHRRWGQRVSMKTLRELVTGVGGGGGGVCVGVLPYSANFQEPLASPVVSWEILREDGPVYQSIQIRFYDTWTYRVYLVYLEKVHLQNSFRALQIFYLNKWLKHVGLN